MSTSRLGDLLRGLTDATEAGRVHWTAESSTSFLLALPSGSVRIKSVDGDGRTPFGMTLHDENGVAIDEMRSVLTTAGQALAPSTIERNRGLRNLYESARTDALNINVVIDKLLQEVESGAGTKPT